jgi:hypothetical protein
MKFNAGRNIHVDFFGIKRGEVKKGIFALNQKKSQGQWVIMPLNKSRKGDTIVLTLKDQIVIRLVLHYLTNIKQKTIFSELKRYIVKELDKKSYEALHLKYILMILWIKGKIRLQRRIADKSSLYWFNKISLKKKK